MIGFDDLAGITEAEAEQLRKWYNESNEEAEKKKEKEGGS